MTIAPPTSTSAAGAARSGYAAVADVTVLLPTREDLLARLAERLPSADLAPATLLIVGLLRRDDGWPTPQGTLAAVTSFLARSLRGDDWLGSTGAAEFAILLAGDESAAESAATRLVHAIAASLPGMSAAAGVVRLTTTVGGAEALRRATLSLDVARRSGGGTVLRYREPV